MVILLYNLDIVSKKLNTLFKHDRVSTSSLREDFTFSFFLLHSVSVLSFHVPLLIILSSCATLYYSNYSHYRVTSETPLSRYCANSPVSLTLETTVR